MEDFRRAENSGSSDDEHKFRCLRKLSVPLPWPQEDYEGLTNYIELNPHGAHARHSSRLQIV
jgi:hypothetical protein